MVATADAASHVLVQQALVIGADGGKDGSPLGGSEVSVTLALPDAGAALAVAHGAAAAELTLLRSTRATEPLPDAYQLPGAPAKASVGSASPATTAAGTADGEHDELTPLQPAGPGPTPGAAWFTELGRWATAGTLPVDFVRSGASEEVRPEHLRRPPILALLVDSSVPGLDRDLVEAPGPGGSQSPPW